MSEDPDRSLDTPSRHAGGTDDGALDAEEQRAVRDRRKGRTFAELMGSDDFGVAWMDYLKVFFSDWNLTTQEVVTLLDNSARSAREALVGKPD